VIRHLLKLVWNRKRANALVMMEIFFSFLVVFAVLAVIVNFASNWGEPLGFEYRDVWAVKMDFSLDARETGTPELRQTVARMVAEAKAFPEVEAATVSTNPPYSGASSGGGWIIQGKRIDLQFDDITDHFGDVMEVKVVRGRWFDEQDDASSYQPVVIDVRAAEAIYGDADPLGKTFDEESEQPTRVVGLIDGYRKDGEISARPNMVFKRISLTKTEGRLGSYILLRVRPGTPAAFEERLVARLQAVAPKMTFGVRSMERMRRDMIRFQMTPLIIGGVLALFLISMVALGLTGVLWQNVTKRTREIGLRRAMGATGPSVHRQILMEVALLATIALVVASVLVLQLPILGVFRLISPAAFTVGFAGALAMVYGLTILCGLYPSWLASRLQPADALRYE
jgi:putative ABC transport system permease protein